MAKQIYFFLAVIMIGILGSGLRIYAAKGLNVDFDEPTYLRVGLENANYLREGHFRTLVSNPAVFEHPALYKISYGLALLTQSPLKILRDKDMTRSTPMSTSGARKWGMAARYLSVFWGTCAVIALALINPLGGLFLATQTISIKYTSEIYLEALPLLTSLLCALGYSKWYESLHAKPSSSRKHHAWLIFSAVALGATAASKYVYCVVGMGILIHFTIALIRKQIPRQTIRWIILWGMVSLICFFVFDPYLWADPWGRLLKSLTFYTSSPEYSYVRNANYPTWQPFFWLLDPASHYDLGPTSAFLLNMDIVIGVLAILGMPRFFRTRPVFFYWFITGLVFLMLWKAKWPQYSLIIMAPFCLAASEGFNTILDVARKILVKKAGLQKQS